MDSLDPVDVGEQMVKLALECLAPLSYHPVIRETIINIDVAVFVKLFKELDFRKKILKKKNSQKKILQKKFSSSVLKPNLLKKVCKKV